MSTVRGRIGRRHKLCAQCGLSPVGEFAEICWQCRDHAQRSTHAEKVEWLLNNPKVWESFERYAWHARDIFKAMQEAGLYSPGTIWTHANIHALVSDARKVRRENSAKAA